MIMTVHVKNIDVPSESFTNELGKIIFTGNVSRFRMVKDTMIITCNHTAFDEMETMRDKFKAQGYTVMLTEIEP